MPLCFWLAWVWVLLQVQAASQVLSLSLMLVLVLLRVLAQTLVQVKVLVKVCAQLIAWQVSGASLAVPFLACPLPSPSVGLSSLLPTLLSVLEALAASLPSAVQ